MMFVSFCEACTEPNNLLYSSNGCSQKTSPGQIKDVNVTKITSFWQTPLKLDGKIIGIDLWKNAEIKYGRLQNSVIYGFVSNVYSVNCGILTRIHTGEFTGDAIHCKLQYLLEHLYYALFIFCLVWWQL